MQFLATLALFAAAAVAAPADLQARADLCNGDLYSQAQCCSTDVLGVADLDCAVPSGTPSNADDFKSTCAAQGKRSRCCTLPLAGLAVLCSDP